MPTHNFINENCKNRIKSSILRDVKSEALLVFSRTALERYFAQVDEVAMEPLFKENEEIAYVYKTLQKLLEDLQECVVNVDYLINISQATKIYPELKHLTKKEEPLIAYYDIMAQKVRNHYKNKPAYLPEFLVVCVLSEWVLGEEKSTHKYPFLDKIDFLELMGKFEKNREHFYKEEECKISEIHELSFQIIEKLKSYKYKENKSRVSKVRKKK
ncbi:hypothetical protein GJV85_10655 [Sulfurimonas aquatica]|uniref:Uncharacterized protein n=1 Tax=Sulfurimonas aquatica TaxID=2672570 RepID=A0A975B2N4_9BACT|nr:hypothetical protein GJV85_10655 [Sulfurimonas aquatica]